MIPRVDEAKGVLGRLADAAAAQVEIEKRAAQRMVEESRQSWRETGEQLKDALPDSLKQQAEVEAQEAQRMVDASKQSWRETGEELKQAAAQLKDAVADRVHKEAQVSARGTTRGGGGLRQIAQEPWACAACRRLICW